MTPTIYERLFCRVDATGTLRFDPKLFVIVVMVFLNLSTLLGIGVGKAIARTEPVPVQLTADQRTSYESQIRAFIPYPEPERILWTGTYQTGDETRVHLFDGAVKNVFVFEDDTLTKYGTSATTDFVRVADLERAP